MSDLPSLKKSSISPFVAVAFIVISVTGAFLFFHFKNGPIMMLHKWFGWAFVVGGLVHLILNWRVLLSYFRRRSGLTSFLVASVLVVALISMGWNQKRGGPGGPRGERPPVAQSE